MKSHAAASSFRFVLCNIVLRIIRVYTVYTNKLRSVSTQGRQRSRATSRRPARRPGLTESGQVARGLQRVGQQHGDRHRTDAAGHRRDGRRDLRRPPRSRRRRRAGRRRRLMPTSITTAPGLTMSPFTNCGMPSAATRMSASRQNAPMSLRAAVTQRHGGVGAFLRQQRRHRLADDVAAADHDGVLAAGRRCPRPPACASRPPACTAGSAAGPAAAGRRSRDENRRRPWRDAPRRGRSSRRCSSAAAVARGCRARPRRRSATCTSASSSACDVSAGSRCSVLLKPAFSQAICLLRT